MNELNRACGRVGCSLQGVWTEQDRCPQCSFPTRQGADAQIAVKRPHALQGSGLVPATGNELAGFGPPHLEDGAALARIRSYPETAVVEGCTVVGGHNLQLEPGTAGVFTCGTKGVAFWAEGNSRTLCPYPNLLNLELGGPGVTRRGGGWIGGGFGLTGMLEGALVASVLNRLTTRTSVNTLIAVTMRDSSMTLHTASATPAQLRLELAPALGRLAVRRHTSKDPVVATAAAEASDPLDRLEKLAHLHATGMLSKEEFEKLKAKIVANFLEE